MGKAHKESGATPKRHMALTADLVARTRRELADEGPDPTLTYHSDADYAAITAEMLAELKPGEPCWLFAYGSLIWKPEVPHVAEARGVAFGYHRTFCFRVARFRGMRAQPGLMMALDRGGQCTGMLYQLPAEDLAGHIDKLFRREFTVKPPNCRPRWVRVRAEAGSAADGATRAIAFVMNRTSPNYVGALPPAEIAEILSRACGHWGSCAEYLYQTVAHLEEKGIHDRHLWHLQQLVADRLAAKLPSPQPLSPKGRGAQ